MSSQATWIIQRLPLPSFISSQRNCFHSSLNFYELLIIYTGPKISALLLKWREVLYPLPIGSSHYIYFYFPFLFRGETFSWEKEDVFTVKSSSLNHLNKNKIAVYSVVLPSLSRFTHLREEEYLHPVKFPLQNFVRVKIYSYYILYISIIWKEISLNYLKLSRFRRE